MLGSSKQLNVAPEAALSLLVGQAVTGAIRSDPHHPPADPEAVAIAITTVITLQVRNILLHLTKSLIQPGRNIFISFRLF